VRGDSVPRPFEPLIEKEEWHFTAVHHEEVCEAITARSKSRAEPGALDRCVHHAKGAACLGKHLDVTTVDEDSEFLSFEIESTASGGSWIEVGEEVDVVHVVEKRSLERCKELTRATRKGNSNTLSQECLATAASTMFACTSGVDSKEIDCPGS